MPRDESAKLTERARWAAVVVLGTLGGLGVVRGLTSPPAGLLGGSDARTVAASGPARASSVGGGGTEAAGGGTGAGIGASSASPVRLINVNTASAAELDLLPGIGPALAGRIIAHREANGPFGSLDDLDDVSGIGPKTVAKLVPYATAE